LHLKKFLGDIDSITLEPFRAKHLDTDSSSYICIHPFATVMASSGLSPASMLLIFIALFISISNAFPARSSKRQDVGSYDFIIVGGGTAGLTLAARLSEDETNSVLVLEAGGRPDAVASYRTPGADQQVLGSPIDWAFGTLPQPGLNGRQLIYNQGRCLGGSSAINGLAYTRGSSSIYDLWRSLGSSGWSWEDVLPYFKKVQILVLDTNESLLKTIIVYNIQPTLDEQYYCARLRCIVVL
jgi:hypothetical protein